MTTQAGYKITDPNELKTLQESDLARVGQDIYRRDLAKEQNAMKTWDGGRGTTETDSAFNSSVYAPKKTDLNTGSLGDMPEPKADIARQSFVDRTIQDGALQKEKAKIELEQYDKNQADISKLTSELNTLKSNKSDDITDFESQIKPIQDKLVSKYGEAADVLSDVDLKAKYAEIEKHTDNAIKLANSMNSELETNRARGGLTSFSMGREKNILDSYTSKITAEQASAELLAGNVQIAFDWVDRGASTVQNNLVDQQQFLGYVSQLYDSDILKTEVKLEGAEEVEKSQIKSLLAEIDADIAKVEQSKDLIKNLMNSDPTIMSKAGLEFGDTEEEIMTKVSDYYANNPQAVDGLSLNEKLSLYDKGLVLDSDGNLSVDTSGANASQVANAIKKIESNNNYDATGASGEHGAYQFMPGTWLEWSREYNKSVNGDINALEMTPENQDAVAQFKIQQWLDQGLSPQQIAAKWNSGSEVGWENKVGVNSQGVSYDVPAYVRKFSSALGADFNANSISSEDLLQAKSLAVDIFGMRAGAKEENVKLITDLMQDGGNIDSIKDSLRYAGQSAKFEGVIRDASESISLGLTKDQSEKFFDSLDRSIEEGNDERVKTLLKKAVVDSLGTDEQKVVKGKERTVEFMAEIAGDIKDFEAGGGETNIFRGTAEKISNKVGKITDKNLAKIATKIQTAIQQYRRSMSGVAFSVEESKEYANLFPGIDKDKNFNLSRISALTETFNGDLDYLYGFTMGEDAYETIFNGKTSNEDFFGGIEADLSSVSNEEFINNIPQ